MNYEPTIDLFDDLHRPETFCTHPVGLKPRFCKRLSETMHRVHLPTSYIIHSQIPFAASAKHIGTIRL